MSDLETHIEKLEKINKKLNEKESLSRNTEIYFSGQRILNNFEMDENGTSACVSSQTYVNGNSETSSNNNSEYSFSINPFNPNNYYPISGSKKLRKDLLTSKND